MELITQGFDVSYQVERLQSCPRGVVHDFRTTRRPVRAGELVLETKPESVLLKVAPFDGEPWVGNFECGPEGITGLYATPRVDVLCVVVRGQGFWIPVLSPKAFEIIRSLPIKEIHQVPGRSMLVFMDYTRLAAYGTEGFLWQTDRLSWDGLRITEMTENAIRGMAWDSPANQDVPFSVDTGSGASEGGSSPTKHGAR